MDDCPLKLNKLLKLPETTSDEEKYKLEQLTNYANQLGLNSSSKSKTGGGLPETLFGMKKFFANLYPNCKSIRVVDASISSKSLTLKICKQDIYDILIHKKLNDDFKISQIKGIIETYKSKKSDVDTNKFFPKDIFDIALTHDFSSALLNFLLDYNLKYHSDNILVKIILTRDFDLIKKFIDKTTYILSNDSHFINAFITGNYEIAKLFIDKRFNVSGIFNALYTILSNIYLYSSTTNPQHKLLRDEEDYYDYATIENTIVLILQYIIDSNTVNFRDIDDSKYNNNILITLIFHLDYSRLYSFLFDNNAQFKYKMSRFYLYNDGKFQFTTLNIEKVRKRKLTDLFKNKFNRYKLTAETFYYMRLIRFCISRNKPKMLKTYIEKLSENDELYFNILEADFKDNIHFLKEIFSINTDNVKACGIENLFVHIHENKSINDNVKIMIEELGIDINSISDSHETPLYLAIFYKDLEGIDYLLSKGANVNIETDGGNAFYWAIKSHDKKLFYVFYKNNITFKFLTDIKQLNAHDIIFLKSFYKHYLRLIIRRFNKYGNIPTQIREKIIINTLFGFDSDSKLGLKLNERLGIDVNKTPSKSKSK